MNGRGEVSTFTLTSGIHLPLPIYTEQYTDKALLTSVGKDIKNKVEILSLLEALQLPKKVVIIHYPGHQKIRDVVAKGNQMADLTAKQAARRKNPGSKGA
jgi:ribonuclease HI